MELSTDQKESVFKDLIISAAQALKDGNISRAELMLISSSLLRAHASIATKEQLLDYIQELSDNWEIFETSLTMLKNEGSAEKDQQTVTEMEALLKSNQVDAAVAKGQEGVNHA